MRLDSKYLEAKLRAVIGQYLKSSYLVSRSMLKSLLVNQGLSAIRIRVTEINSDKKE